MLRRSISSLQARLTLRVVATLIVSLWALALLIDHHQRDRLTNLLAGQQYATVSYLAEDVDNKIRLRVAGLNKVIERFPLDILERPAALAEFLEDRRAIYNLFDLGLIVVKPDLSGAFGDHPALPGRRSSEFRLAPYDEVAATGRPAIGPPRIGRFSNRPVIVMAVPVKDDSGRIRAIVSGVATIDSTDFLELVTRRREGSAGEFLIAAPKYGLTIAGTRVGQVLQPLPERGKDPVFDRYVDGKQGYDVATGADGDDELVAARRVSLADWFVMGRLPAREAYGPVRELRTLVFGGSAVLSVLIGIMAAVFLRRALRPLKDAAATFDSISQGLLPLHPLPVTGNDEVSGLVESFNRLQERLSEETEALRQCSEAIAMVDPDLKFRYVNPAFERLFGYSLDEVRGRHMSLLVPPAGDGEGNELVVDAFEGERIRRAKDGRLIPLLLKVGPVRDVDGNTTGFVGTMTDLSAIKATERALRESEARYRRFVEDSPLGVLILREGVVMFANRALADLLGYSEQEVIGKSFQTFLVDDDRERATDAYRRRIEGEPVPGMSEYRVITRGGEVRHWRLASRAIDWNGPASHSVVTDVTELKRAEARLEHSAHFDALTGIPNRVLLADRLRQGLMQSSRANRLMAICYLDLDGFKPINDTWGHEAGDLLLVEMAARLKLCLRGGDTVARLGGDEFVLLLLGLERIEECESAMQRVLESIAQPVKVGDQLVTVSASIGVSIFPRNGNDPDVLLRQADQAMYLAKETGRNRYRFFEAAEMHAAMR